MKTLNSLLTALLLVVCMPLGVQAQSYNEMDADGNVTQRNESGAFNPNRNDTTKTNKEVPKGVWAWTVDRRFGDITPAELDTMPHLYQNTIYATGLYGEYNMLSNNYSARQSRIFIDRPDIGEFFFTDAYSYTTVEPEQFLYINTLSPYANLRYENCGDKQHGEDHFRAKFAVNAGKRLGMGFDLDYHYATGYYSDVNNSHFRASLFGSYRGDRYQMHLLASAYHRKASENGGITKDSYITHPEQEESQYSEEEIPTVLSQNWNRNNSQHLFFSHRYNIGFYRKVKMTDEEIKARQFAAKSAKDKERREKAGGTDKLRGRSKESDADRKKAEENVPKGRPSSARIAGDEPVKGKQQQVADTTRITVDGEQQMDSLLAEQHRQDSIDATMKKEYVPVTSIIHTLDVDNYDRIYQAYATPNNYYADTFYDADDEGRSTGVAIYDKYKYTSIKNTVGLALLEGFNKYMKAGLKGFISYQMCKFQMPDLSEGATAYHMKSWNEYGLNIGGKLSKTQGKTFHFNLEAELGVTGRDRGMLKADFSTDLNFALFGDTVRLAASAFFYRNKPTSFMESFHSKHLWWDQSLSAETRTHLEGNFSYEKTDTRLRVAIDEIQNYTYFGMSYNITSAGGREAMTAGVYQNKSNINVLTLQLKQNLRWGVLNWENVLTYQNSSSKDVLPLPTLNVFSNLYLKFKIARVLLVELGGNLTCFTKYAAPDFVPQLNQFAVQQNSESRVELGGYPFVDIYANMHLKRTRFFVAMSHVNAGSGSKNYFLTPHYPTNTRILRFGVSWNFYN